MVPRQVRIMSDGATLDGDLVIPQGATGVVAFAHGSGSSRHSPRNRAVAGILQGSGLGTLLLDLLTQDEERIDEVTSEYRFDIPVLGRRMTSAVDWLAGDPATESLPTGLFGASTGAAAALRTAAERPDNVRAVVSRGGRPDLAGDEMLGRVRAPVLLVVGGADREVLQLNEQAAALLGGPHMVFVVRGATHLFEEPGTLERAANAARDWFVDMARSGSRR